MAVAKIFNDDGGTLPTGSGSGSNTTENLSNQIDGVKTSFTTSDKFVSGTLKVYYNGLREVDVTAAASRTSFTLSYNPLAGDHLIVDYEIDSE